MQIIRGLSPDFAEFLEGELRRADRENLRRRLVPLERASTTDVRSKGAVIRNFSSNDYLGLSTHPALQQAARDAIERSGAGSAASRLVCGSLPEHEHLETSIARFKRTEAALSFSSGYAAALGTIPALAGSRDIIILDKLCHACLVDGARLSGATLRVFPHNDMTALEERLRWARKHHPESRVLILAESVYSMDGDIAPLETMVGLKDAYRAWLLLDEAHGVGVLGADGRGLADLTGLNDRIELQMGTLGKALGASGAYIAGTVALREFLINRARSFIFSTAPAPAAAAAATAAIELLENPATAHPLLEALHQNITHFCETANLPHSPTPIIPVILKSEAAALKAARDLNEAGFLVPAIRFPTVPRGTARLRITLSSAHTRQDISALAAALLPLQTQAAS